MTRIPLQSKDNFEHFRVASQVDFIGDSWVNHALIAVAQEVAELLKQEACQLEQDSSGLICDNKECSTVSFLPNNVQT